MPTAFYITAVEIPNSARSSGSSSRRPASRRSSGCSSRRAASWCPCVNEALATLERGRHARRDSSSSGSPTSWTCPSSSDPPGARPGSPSERELERSAGSRSRDARPVDASSRAARRCVVFGVLGRRLVQLAGLAERCRRPSSTGTTPRTSFPAILDGFWLNVQLFLLAEPLILVARAGRRPGPAGRSPLAGAGPRRWPSVYTDLFRGIPTILLVFLLVLRRAGAGAAGRAEQPVLLALVALVLVVRRLRRRGLPRRHRVGAPLPGRERRGARAEPRPDDAVRRGAAGGAPGGAAAAQRLRLAAEGHRAGRRRSGVFDALGAASDTANFNFNYTPYVVVAAFFVALTIPLARLTDWLGAGGTRERAGAP